MQAERISVALPVPDLSEAVQFWETVLGVEPTFVDRDRWAQFDASGARVSLAGTDRVSDAPTVMVKVADLDQACEELAAQGALGLGHRHRRT